MSDPLDLQMRTQHLRVIADERSGSVRWFSAEKGYGFIAPHDGGDDVFVRHSSIDTDGFRSLDPGQEVRYRVSDDGRGPRAIQVRPE